MNFTKLKSLTIPEGKVKKIMVKDKVLWKRPFVNQIPISTDLDGSIYNGVGYKTNTRLNDVSGNVVDSNGFVTTGFIPMEYYGSSQEAYGEVIVYLKDVLYDATSVWILLYNANKERISTVYGSQLVTEPQRLRVIKTLDENGYINSLDFTSITAYFARNNVDDGAKFIRFAGPPNDAISPNSIITVNEQIE